MRASSKAALAAALVLVASPSLAQEPAGATLPPSSDPSPQAATPPALRAHPEAPYPQDALRDRVEGDVELELTIDATGRVREAKVTTPAGHGFDEAALAAVKGWTFEPARKDGAAIESTVAMTYPFKLPPSGAPAPTESAAPVSSPVGPGGAAPATPTLQAGEESTRVLGQKPISAASSFEVRDRDFQLRPVGSVQDILRVTPGLVMVQHSGGGKANQYFLRGFDADHGTDIALSIDGIPINMVSHAHGQGFADTNFIIPETVERVEITKGPYFAGQGDFATAGAVNLVTRDDFEHSSLGFGVGGSPGYGGPSYRGLLVASPKFDAAKAMFAAEIGRQDGPFVNPEGWDRYKLFNKITFPITPASSFTIGESSYSGNWNGSGQIPPRAVEQGLISRYGSLDPSEGGNSARHQLFVGYTVRPTEDSELKTLAYAGTYRFNLYSDFTFFENDPVNGDEIEQVDRRTFYGGQLSYRVVHTLGPVRFDTTLGGSLRSDDIHEELWHTKDRAQLSQLRGNGPHETMIGAYVNEEVTPASWLRVDLGGRADMLSFAVDSALATPDPTAPTSGVGATHQFSPKASAVVTPLDREGARVEGYLNFGNGFHSNDVRGVFTTPSVTPLTRAIGEEVGARGRFWDRLDVAASGWMLDLDSETVWNGDDGTTGVAGPTHRYGLELEGRIEITPWLAADGNVSFTKSYFSTDGANGGGLALAPKQTWAGGLSARRELGPGVARAGLRFYGIGDRPATDDGALVAPGFTQFDLHLGYRHRRFDIALDIENLFNGMFRSAQFATVSRLANEPAIGTPLNQVSPGLCGSKGRFALNADGSAPSSFNGCEDVHYTPAYPFTARVMATVFLD